MKILLPVDGSEGALDAVRHALRLQREGLRASFVLAAVQEPTYTFEMMLPPDAEVLDRLTGAEGTRALKGAVALLEATGLNFEREIGSGDPAPALLEIAQRFECEAIIMGARGRGGAAKRLARLGLAGGLAGVDRAGHDCQTEQWSNRPLSMQAAQYKPLRRSSPGPSTCEFSCPLTAAPTARLHSPSSRRAAP